MWLPPFRNWREIQAKGQEADFKQSMSEQTAKPSTEQTGQLFMIFRSGRANEIEVSLLCSPDKFHAELAR